VYVCVFVHRCYMVPWFLCSCNLKDSEYSYSESASSPNAERVAWSQHAWLAKV